MYVLPRSVSLCGVTLFLLTMGMGCGWSLPGSDSYQPVTQDEAYVVACSHLDYLGNSDYMLADMIPLLDDRGTLLCYVFHLEPTGYIVVTGYECLPPVIAYSLTTSARYDDATNPLVSFLTRDISLRLQYRNLLSPSVLAERQRAWYQYLGDGPFRQVTYQQWPPAGSTSTGGWLETTWSQDEPYNALCPLDPESGERSVAGCPAIAMGQILNYHQTVNGVKFDDSDDYLHNYAGRRYTIDDDYEAMDFPSFSTLNTFLADLADCYQQDRQPTDQQLAALIFGCGVAATQVYTSEVSGTFAISQACKAYERFGINYTFMDQDYSALYGRLAMNMIDGLPVHLAVVNEEWTAGHNLVVDGYNTDHYFHLNFGWGGTYDGWYLLPQDMRFDLTVVEGVIMDIMHSSYGSDIYCEGSLHWANIAPGEMVTGSFSVTNVGVSTSTLNWSIISHPDWGTWTFSTVGGTNLSVGEKTPVQVTVTAPDHSFRNSTGYIKVANTDNLDDCFIVQVSLATTYLHQSFLLHLLTMLLKSTPLWPSLVPILIP